MLYLIMDTFETQVYDVVRLPEQLTDVQKSVAANCQKHLDQYAKEGLRTLCFTRKVSKPQPCHYCSAFFTTLRLTSQHPITDLNYLPVCTVCQLRHPFHS